MTDFPVDHYDRVSWEVILPGDIVCWVGVTYKVWDIFESNIFEGAMSVRLVEWPDGRRPLMPETVDRYIHVDLVHRDLDTNGLSKFGDL